MDQRAAKADSHDSDLSSEDEFGLSKFGKSRMQELTEQASRIHETEKARRAQLDEDLAMYKRIMNPQQLKTYLATQDLRQDKEYRRLAVDFQVTRTNLDATLLHMTQQMIELEDDSNFNFKNRMDKSKYNAKIKTDMALAESAVAAATNDEAPVTLEPPTTPRIDIDKQLVFQDEFLYSIKVRDVQELQWQVKHALRHYADVMERLICWAELILKEEREKQVVKEYADDIENKDGGTLSETDLMYHRNVRGNLVPNMFDQGENQSK